MYRCLCVLCVLNSDIEVLFFPLLQAASMKRVPVIVVFTHMDQFRSREQREEFRRQKTQWLEYHNKKVYNGLFIIMSCNKIDFVQLVIIT